MNCWFIIILNGTIYEINITLERSMAKDITVKELFELAQKPKDEVLSLSLLRVDVPDQLKSNQ